MLFKERYRLGVFGRLKNQWIVDMYVKMEEIELEKYFKKGCDVKIYTNREQLNQNVVDGGRIRLIRKEFIGGKNFLKDIVRQCFAVSHFFKEKPTFFVTITANLEWKEKEVIGDDDPYSHPAVVSRVFYQKLKSILDLFMSGEFLGGEQYSADYLFYSIEGQGRGTPHSHVLFKPRGRKVVSLSDIDNLISGTLPKNEEDRKLLKKFMTHGKNGKCTKSCLESYKYIRGRNGRIVKKKKVGRYKNTCAKGYPRPISHRTKIDSTQIIFYKTETEEERMIVPYNLNLIKRYNCHINVEYCRSSSAIGYLFQYQFKHKFFSKVRSSVYDEVEIHKRMRVLQSPLCFLRLCGYKLHSIYPNEGKKRARFKKEDKDQKKREKKKKEKKKKSDRSYT